jgi:hypothetical protein
VKDVEQTNSDFEVIRYLIIRGLEIHCRFLLQSFPVGDDESQALVISTVASYYPDAENAVNGFIDGRPTFERLGVISFVKSALTRFINALNASAETLVAHSSVRIFVLALGDIRLSNYFAIACIERRSRRSSRAVQSTRGESPCGLLLIF